MYEKLGSGVLLTLKEVKEGFPFINFYFYICIVGFVYVLVRVQVYVPMYNHT